jgi:hypothetical protein
LKLPAAKSGGVTSLLLNAITIGNRVLYSILHAYSMLLIKVVGFVVRGVSTTYTKHVGNVLLRLSVMICPLADHVNTSI